jgi:hypothetical protein
MEKEKLKEYEEAALLANVPYLLNEGRSPSDIEKDLATYGLNYRIDREKSDIHSAILYNDTHVVHSVRGTDFYEKTDILSDLALAFTHPIVTDTLGTLFGGRQVDRFIRKGGGMLGTAYQDVYYKQMGQKKRDVLYGWESIEDKMYKQIDALEEGGEDIFEDERYEGFRMKHLGMTKQIDKATDKINKIRSETLRNSLKTAGLSTAIQQITKVFLNRRIGREFNKNDALYDAKYAGKEKLLVGHSLGGLVNLIGRNRNIKTITLNPAPQNTEYDPSPINTMLSAFRPSVKLDYDARIKGLRNEPNANSVIYKTTNDPVSAFLGPADKERVVVIDKENPISFTSSHFLANFLPKKQNTPYTPMASVPFDNNKYYIRGAVRQPPKIKPVLVSLPIIKPVLVDLPTGRLENFCSRFPNDKRCR